MTEHDIKEARRDDPATMTVRYETECRRCGSYVRAVADITASVPPEAVFRQLRREFGRGFSSDCDEACRQNVVRYVLET